MRRDRRSRREWLLLIDWMAVVDVDAVRFVMIPVLFLADQSRNSHAKRRLLC